MASIYEKIANSIERISLNQTSFGKSRKKTMLKKELTVDQYTIAPSTIPNAGNGAFTNIPLPKGSVLGNYTGKKLLKEHPEWYVGNYIFLWAFCKFFWEAHVELPHIDINKLENIVIS